MMLTTRQPNQVALVHKLTPVCDLRGVVVSENVPRRPSTGGARRALNRLGGRTVGAPLAAAWSEMLGHYAERWPKLPRVPVTEVTNVNDAGTLAQLRELDAELAVVSGTNLVGPEIIRLMSSRAGIVNLHTGISPYVKGGPNCTNWCLARGWFHLIGSTVMWLAPGIDDGDLIATERTPLTGVESLAGLHWSVMEHAHDLYVRSVGRIVDGKAVPGVPQAEIGEGRTFYTAQWTPREMLRARLNFRRSYRIDVSAGAPGHPEPKLVPLPEEDTGT